MKAYREGPCVKGVPVRNGAFTRRGALCLAAAIGASLVALPGCSSDSVPWDNTSNRNTNKATSTTTSEGWILQEAGKLKVAAWLDYMPFEGESGFKEMGFTYQYMEKVADKLGLELEYVSSPSQERVVAAVTDGTKVDLGVSSLEPTSSLKSQCLVTDPYLELGVAVSVIRDVGITSTDQLGGRKVGIVPNSTSAKWAKANLAATGCEFVEYEDLTFLFAALQAYNVDAVVSSYEYARYFLRMKLTNATVIHHESSDERFVMALAKGNDALCAALNEVIAELKSDGTHQALYDSWFYETVVDQSQQESRTPEQGAPGYAKGA